MRFGLTVCAIGFAALATVTGAARAEIAGGGLAPDGNGTYLLYVEGDRVHRRECDRTSTIHDHAHCALKPSSAPVGSFFALLPTKFANQLAGFDKDAQEAWIKLQQIDGRLFQAVNGQAPTANDPVTEAQITTATRAVDDAERKATELRDQIARLAADLAENRGDAADLEQLALDRTQLIKLEGDKTVASAALLTLRQNYVAQRADASSANFRDLIGLRAAQSDAYDRARYNASFELKDLSCAELMASRIKETGFVWEAACNLQTHFPDSNLGGTLSRIGLAYDEAELADRTYTGVSDGGRMVHVVVPRSGLIRGVRCDYPQAGPQAQFEGELAIEAPGDLTAEIPLNVTGAVVTVTWTYALFGSNWSVLDEKHFERYNGGGRWTFELIPHFIVIGGGAPASALPKCSVTLRNPEES